MSAGAAAAAAAAAQLRMQQAEEEVMKTYTPDELTHDWEFKIVRANRPVFRNPDTFRRLLEEESRAGWTMVEKFDNSRVRFKRPQRARFTDAQLPPDVDPYRVHYGLPPAAFALFLVAAILLLTGGIILATVLFANARIH